MSDYWQFDISEIDLLKNRKKVYNLFGPPPALSLAYQESSNMNMPSLTNVESAPFSIEDIEPIIDILSRCPNETDFQRIFTQHPELGTCWYDSFWMMFFENSEIKPFLLPFIKLTLEVYLKFGISDLSYASLETSKVGNNNEKGNSVEVKLEDKINLLAEIFKSVTKSPEEITFYNWQIFAHALQKYILLGYLFYKYREEVSKSLRKRRGSVNTKIFNQLHKKLRKVIGANYCGADDVSIRNFIIQINPLLQFVTKGTYTISPFTITNENLPSKAEGYYIVLKNIENPLFGHVICMYKCGGVWSIFDNEKGNYILSEDFSEKISKHGFREVQYKYLVGNPGILQYSIQFHDGTELIIDKEIDNEIKKEKLYRFSEAASYRLLKLGMKGGKRKSRTRKQKKSSK